MAFLFLNAPTSFALSLHLMGCSVFSPLSFQSPDMFNTQQSSNGPFPPYMATAIVSLGIAILLSQYSLWPSSFRKPPKPLLFLIQLLFALFVFEFTLNMMWYPLEGLIYDLLQNATQMLKNPNVKKQKNISLCCQIMQTIVDILSCKIIPVVASYIMSLAFLGCVLHITKIHDVYKSSC